MRVLDALEKKVNRTSYETWLKPTRYDHAQGPILFVRVPNPEFCHIGERYGDLISEAIENLGLEFRDVEFVTEEEQQKARNDGNGADPHREAPANTDKPVGGPATQQRFDWDGAAQLNPKYTFDDFVIGAGNQFAHAAARAVAERPSKAYNPLFLYGGVGMGKTHLMQAIGHEIKKRSPQTSICYVSSERFTNDMINALRYSKMTGFRDKYRNMDVLLIDDIQFLVNKERTQEEFFHTFNALHECMRQIVIASDRPPKELAEIEDRLRSRFEWGLIADIQPPDLETKVAILQKKAESEQVMLPTDVALFIASNIRSNVRELEGALIRLTAYSSLTGGEVNLQSRAGSSEEPDRLPGPQGHRSSRFKRRCASSSVCARPEIKAKNNSRVIVFPRQIAMYLSKHLTDASLPEIGRQFGGKHHTTVLHSVEKIEVVRKTDKDLNRMLNKLTESLGL